MADPIHPIDPDRSVPVVEFRRLTRIERDEQKQQRERRRERNAKAEKRASDGSGDGHPGIDVRV